MPSIPIVSVALSSSGYDSSDLIAAIPPSLNLLLIGTSLSSTLVPVCIVLLFFSTHRTLGLTLRAVNGYNQARTLLGSSIPPEFSLAYMSLTILVPMVANRVLVLRVMAVYPPRELPVRTLVVIYGPVAFLKIACAVIDVMFIIEWTRAVVRNGESPFQAGQEAWTSAYPKLAWCFQLCDSTYASTIFLLRLHKGMKNAVSFRLSVNVIRTDEEQDERSYYHRLQTIFWISASNFVFPVIFNLAQLVLVFRDPSFLDGAYIFLVNTYVQILGVLLATIWSSGTKEDNSPSPDSAGEDADVAEDSGSPLRFAPVESPVDQDSDGLAGDCEERCLSMAAVAARSERLGKPLASSEWGLQMPPCAVAAIMSIEYLFPQAKVLLATRSLSLCIEKVNHLGSSINAGCNHYDVSIAIVELGPKLHTLLAKPLSSTEKAFLAPPDQVVLRFWDHGLSSSHRQGSDKQFVITDDEKLTRYVFQFEDDVEFTTCMELFFITRRFARCCDRAIDVLERQVFPMLSGQPADVSPGTGEDSANPYISPAVASM